MRTEALIDTKALTHNLTRVKKFTPKAKVLAMIKANAYGHGLLLCAKTLSEADYLGVATIEEAYALRLHGISKRVVLTPGFTNSQELQYIIDLELDTFVHHPHQIELLKKHKSNHKIPIWFKVNTGMNRLGINYHEARTDLQTLERLPNIEIACIISHLACSDEKDRPHLLTQLEQFDKFSKNLNYPKSLLNSAGIIHYPEYAYDIVRPGLMLYGASPCTDHNTQELNLDPVMTLSTTILSIYNIKKGEGVGYGQDWQAQRDSRIAVAACGYGDGYPQKPINGKVYYQGQLLPIIGRISMDYLCVDITDCQNNIIMGDKFELWGKNYTINSASKDIGISDYVLLTGVMARIPRKDTIGKHAYHQSFKQFKKPLQFKTKKFTSSLIPAKDDEQDLE